MAEKVLFSFVYYAAVFFRGLFKDVFGNFVKGQDLQRKNVFL